jgi:MerR family transcriptional regulator, copper efflux regulator
MERPLTIGQLACATGVPAKTIRYYEQVGVLPVPRGSDAGYRHYSRHDVHRLLFIRRARALGLSLTNLKDLTAELDSGKCLTMRPRLHALMTEQLHTVQQQIAEFRVLERQLTQVLQRLQTTAPRSYANGCQCLGNETPETQEPHDLSIPLKGATMPTSTLEPLTILAPSPLSEPNSADDEQCGCGCGCGVSLTQLALPQDAMQRRGDAASAPPA